MKIYQVRYTDVGGDYTSPITKELYFLSDCLDDAAEDGKWAVDQDEYVVYDVFEIDDQPGWIKAYNNLQGVMDESDDLGISLGVEETIRHVAEDALMKLFDEWVANR